MDYRPLIAVQIIRFVSDDQPGFVECELEDALGQVHHFIDKVPVVAVDDVLSADSVYPAAGVLACTILAEWTDAQGRALVQVSTREPWYIEATDGRQEFVILATQLMR